MTWIIRDAVPDLDAEACRDIYAPFVSDTTVSFEEQVPTVDEFLGRIRAAQAGHAWLVVEDAGRVVGYAYASQHRARPAYRWAVDVTVYLAPSHHRRGFGRLLYTELFARLRKLGYQVACAGITLPNEGSVDLHTAMGYKSVGAYKRIGWKAGAWRDVAWFQLELVPATETQPPELKTSP
jgi:L-amino acid N-acyltransferase YncA